MKFAEIYTHKIYVLYDYYMYVCLHLRLINVFKYMYYIVSNFVG